VFSMRCLSGIGQEKNQPETHFAFRAGQVKAKPRR
jgi:hypothetical protein